MTIFPSDSMTYRQVIRYFKPTHVLSMGTTNIKIMINILEQEIELSVKMMQHAERAAMLKLDYVTKRATADITSWHDYLSVLSEELFAQKILKLCHTGK